MGVFALQATASAYGYLNIDKEFAEYVAKGISQARIPEAPDSVRLRFERSDRSGPYDIVRHSEGHPEQISCYQEGFTECY